MSKLNFTKVVEEICSTDERYTPDAYVFIRESLDYTLKSLKRQGQGANRHVTGLELLQGVKEYALKEFGPMTKMVLNEWGIKKCEDFGHIVFNLVRNGVLGKTEADSPGDFKNGFNFHEAFVKPFRPRDDLRKDSRPKIQRHSSSKKRTSKSNTPTGY